MSDLIERLNDDVRQLTKMVEHAKLAGPETGVRVKDPSLLLADLSEAASRISQQDDELELVRRELADMTISRDGYAKQAMAREAEGRRSAFIEAAEIVEGRASYWNGLKPIDNLVMTKEQMGEIFLEKRLALGSVAKTIRARARARAKAEESRT
ncbi:hypothetical protein IB276_11875 [Ensifer sp. ENS04]|uniref:hypothetical protein n=1 Tax=Ensifer sp. ENS04 TaxID=2769281 RepID=UPI001782245B|nr:hypothetical protein [Ensifer sp. ENS04]MBD9540152.1 hypothetical protein [Ensifer sp. ENS04]